MKERLSGPVAKQQGGTLQKCYTWVQFPPGPRRGGGMVDTKDLKSFGSNPVRVRVPPPAPKH